MAQYNFAQPPAYIEEFQRNLLQGAFDATKTPFAGGIPKQGITGFQPLQSGAIQGTAGLYGIDPTTGKPTGAGTAFDPFFKTAQDAVGCWYARNWCWSNNSGSRHPVITSSATTI